MLYKDDGSEREESLTQQLVDHILWVVDDSCDKKDSSLVEDKGRPNEDGHFILLSLPLQIQSDKESAISSVERFIKPAISLAIVEDHQDYRENGDTQAKGVCKDVARRWSIKYIIIAPVCCLDINYSIN